MATEQWRVSKGLGKLREQLNDIYPNRSKASDGSIGDTRHAASKSDHNPDPDGTVDAIDITHDPKEGVDIANLVDVLIKNKDKRVSYIIANGQIISGRKGPQPWVRRKYTGANKHTKHLHISILDENQDDTSPWDLSGLKAQVSAPSTWLTDKKDIAQVQSDLWNLGYTEVGSRRKDGTFDGVAGDMTRAAVMAFRDNRGLVPSPDVNKLLITQLHRAKMEGFKRPVEKARLVATTEEIASKAPEVAANVTTRNVAKWGTIGSAAFGIGDGILQNLGSARGYIDQVQDYLTVPRWTILLVVAAVAAFLYYKSRKGVEAGEEAWKTGARR